MKQLNLALSAALLASILSACSETDPPSDVGTGCDPSQPLTSCTPALTPGGVANKPFPNHTTYTSGSALPSAGQTTMDQEVEVFYDQWKSAYLATTACGNTTYYYVNVNAFPGGVADASAITVSEGHSYGMLITALMAGYDPDAKTIFDSLNALFLQNQVSNAPYLMDWDIDGGCVLPSGGNSSATDGDLDIAFALLLADNQWGSTGATNYRTEAENVINSIKTHEALNASTLTTTNPNFLVVGNWAQTDSTHKNGTRSSDFMGDHFRLFKNVTGDSAWQDILDEAYTIISTIQTNNSTSGLLPDFIIDLSTTPVPPSGEFLETVADGEYGYNACRDPWRLGTDYLISGEARALTALQKINTWYVSSAGPGTDPSITGDHYNLAGQKQTNGNNSAFVAPFGIGLMASSANQTEIDAVWAALVSKGVRSSYFADTIQMVNMIVMSGNWWAPL